jgi:hypothetical protein
MTGGASGETPRRTGSPPYGYATTTPPVCVPTSPTGRGYLSTCFTYLMCRQRYQTESQ